MADETLIKRYANRRLYDTGRSSYITLEDLAERVREGERIKVLDARDETDLTRRILLQVLLLEGPSITDLLPLDFLYLLVRVRDPAMTELFLRYLRMSMEAFQFARSQMEDNLRRFRQQSSLATQWMAGLFPAGLFGMGAAAEGGPAPAAPGPPSAPPATPPEGEEPR